MKGKKNQLQDQKQIEIEAVVLEEMQECLYDSLEWLEVYIENTGYYPDWQQRKQLPKSIERENVRFMDANEVKGFFSTVLFSLSNFAKTSGVPFVLERLQTQFYSWLDKSGIKADNCPKELAKCLVNINNVLNGKGEGFRKARREEVEKNISQMTSKEQEGKFYGAITELQKNLKNEEAWLEASKNKSPQDVKMENKFFGNPDRGKEIFKQIERSIKEKQIISERQKAQQDYRQWEQEQDEMEGIEGSNSTTNYQQKHSKSDLANIGNTDKPNKDNKFGTIATISIFSALLIGGVVLAARSKLKKPKNKFTKFPK